MIDKDAEISRLAAELEAIEIAKDVEVELRMRDQARIAALEAALDECCHDWRDTKVWLTNSAIGRAARGFTSETPVQVVCPCGFDSCNRNRLKPNEYCWKDRQAAGLAQETKVVCPDWGDYHNFNAGRCSCGESNAQTSVDRGTK